MWKVYENFHIFYFQKRIVSAETIRRNTVSQSNVHVREKAILLNVTLDN